MALWSLYRMETDPNVGPVSLTCVTGENPIKFTLYDNAERVYSTISACIPESDATSDILHTLEVAGYTPNDWS